jgi:hypothetical protein
LFWDIFCGKGKSLPRADESPKPKLLPLNFLYHPPAQQTIERTAPSTSQTT